MKWYEDEKLVSALPFRYRAYATYSSLAATPESRRVRGGSFILRMLKVASNLARKSTVAPVRGIDGLTVVTDFADERVLEVIHEIRGENPEYRILRAFLPEGGVFVDVGANFGTFSLLASRLVGPAGKVIAIEPQQRLASLIEQSLALSGVTNCEVKRMACGSGSEKQLLLVPSDDSGRGGFFPGFSGRPGHVSEQVTVMTLDSMFASRQPSRIALIKVDVEGSELDVLGGAESTINDSRAAILIELNPWSAKAAGHTTKDVIDRLISLGYSSFATAESYPHTLDPWTIPPHKQINLVASF